MLISLFSLHLGQTSKCVLRLCLIYATTVVIGRDFLDQHQSVEILFGGNLQKLTICGLAESLLPAPRLFSNLLSDCRLIAKPSRRFNNSDKNFIEIETNKLLTEEIIEPSSLPWRAQVVITTNERHRKRLVIDLLANY